MSDKAKLAALLATLTGPDHANPQSPWYTPPMPRQGPYSPLNRRFVAEALGPSAVLVLPGQTASKKWWDKD